MLSVNSRGTARGDIDNNALQRKILHVHTGWSHVLDDALRRIALDLMLAILDHANNLILHIALTDHNSCFALSICILLPHVVPDAVLVAEEKLRPIGDRVDGDPLPLTVDALLAQLSIKQGLVHFNINPSAWFKQH